MLIIANLIAKNKISFNLFWYQLSFVCLFKWFISSNSWLNTIWVFYCVYLSQITLSWMSTQVPYLFRFAQYNWLKIYPSCGGIGSYIITASYICSFMACHTILVLLARCSTTSSQVWVSVPAPREAPRTSLTQVWTYIICVLVWQKTSHTHKALLSPRLKISSSPFSFSSSPAIPKSSPLHV